MQAKIMGVVARVVFVWEFMVVIWHAQSEESVVPSIGTFSGRFISTASYTNGDGLKAGFFTGSGKDSVGRGEVYHPKHDRKLCFRIASLSQWKPEA